MVSSKRLLKYLFANKHWSPLEMVSVCLEISTTRDIARQILRHRSFSFQEFSMRYSNPLENNLTMILREARLQDVKNRQNSIDTNDTVLKQKWEEVQKDILVKCSSSYNWAIENGIAKEQARAVLPEGMMESKLYMNGTLRSWIHYIELRQENGTQKEHREIAIKCKNEITPIFPLINDLI